MYAHYISITVYLIRTEAERQRAKKQPKNVKLPPDDDDDGWAKSCQFIAIKLNPENRIRMKIYPFYSQLISYKNTNAIRRHIHPHQCSDRFPIVRTQCIEIVNHLIFITSFSVCLVSAYVSSQPDFGSFSRQFQILHQKLLKCSNNLIREILIITSTGLLLKIYTNKWNKIVNQPQPSNHI